jgi:hypothetical protein
MTYEERTPGLNFHDARGHVIGPFIGGESLSAEEAESLSLSLARAPRSRREIANQTVQVDKVWKELVREKATLSALMSDGSGRDLETAKAILEILAEDPDYYRDPLESVTTWMRDGDAINAVESLGDADSAEPIDEFYSVWSTEDENEETHSRSTLARAEEMLNMLADPNFFRYTPEGKRLKAEGQPVPVSEKWLSARWEESARRKAKARRYFGIEEICLNAAGELLAPNKDPRKGGRPRKVAMQ